MKTLKIKSENLIAILHIKISYNNIIVTCTDLNGNSLYSISSGCLGYKGTKKSCNISGEKLGNVIAEKLNKLGVKSIQIHFRGKNLGREIFMKTFLKNFIFINKIVYKKSIPYNGCRPPKKRRI